MKLKPKTLLTLISTIAIGLIIILLAKIHPDYLLAAHRMQFPKYAIYIIIFAALSIAIGVLLEFKRLICGFKNGFMINKIGLIFSLILAVILFLPPSVTLHFGFRWWTTIVQYGLFRSILSIICGVSIVRSITKKDTAPETK